jgi:hypothetical protein
MPQAPGFDGANASEFDGTSRFAFVARTAPATWSGACSSEGEEVAMRITIDMPSVLACEATRCAYNVDQSCHARAITVGDGSHPACDTFFPANEHTHRADNAGVGACKVSSCRYNDDLECSASGVRVGIHQGHADCVTFSPQ